MSKAITSYFLCLLFSIPLSAAVPPYNGCVNMHLGGRLGNQMFQIAAALSLAEDYGAEALFPDLIDRKTEQVQLNHKCFYPSILAKRPQGKSSYVFYEHPHFHYQPIPFRPNMEVFGYFQSEKYFKNHKDKVCETFAPSPEIKQYLTTTYRDLLDHPNTVAIHLRAYKLEALSIENCFPFLPSAFYMAAAELFPEDALFVIFSDQIDWAKKELASFKRPHIFIENEPHYHDFYLMSFCKHQILSASSFGWWAAYLNKNPEKKVVAPQPWFSPISGHDGSNVIPEGWVCLYWQAGQNYRSCLKQ